MVEVTFTDWAVDDLRRVGPEAVPKILKKVLLLLEDPRAGYPLGGDLTGYRKLVVGRNTWRIVYRVVDDSTIEVCEVWAVGARADAEVYAAAAARVREADTSQPNVARLAEVVEQLGSLTGDVAVATPEAREPVPDWLANRLIHTVRMSREDVAALDLEEAVDAWTRFTSAPRHDS